MNATKVSTVKGRTTSSVQKTKATGKNGKHNPMRQIRIEKVTLNIGAGKNEDLLKRGLVLLEKLTHVKPVKTITSKRIPGWGLRPGLAIGAKVSVRKNCNELLQRLLVAKNNILQEKNFDETGNVSFGISEYIDIGGMEYDPDLKIMGLEVAVTLTRPGYRIKKRRVRPGKIGSSHVITKNEAISFVKSLSVEVVA